MSMKQISSQIKGVEAYKTADTLNYEGFPAWEMPLEKRFRQVLFTGTFGNTFYASQKEIVKQGIDTIREGIEKLPVEYVASTIVDARNKGFIRTAPIVALILLREKDKNAFKDIFSKVVITGNDLEDFFTLSRSFEKGFGRVVKETINDWLKKVNEFYAIKYRRQIADAMRIAHPDFDSPVLDYVAKTFRKNPKEVDLDKLPQIKAFEEAKNLLSQGKIDEAVEHIREGRVPATALLGVISTDDARYWKALAEQMGTMQLLKYINKLLSIGIHKGFIKERINVQSLKKAKVLPFRLAIASRNVTDKEISQYLLEVAVNYAKEYDWNKWQGKWAICPDVSGSMTSGRNDIRPADVAGVFSGILKAGLPQSRVLAWDTEVYDLSHLEPVNVIDKVTNAHGGGTYMEKPVKFLLEKNIEVDYVLFITDTEEWGKGWLQCWKDYKRKYPEAKAIFIRVDSYNTQPYSTEAQQQYGIYDVFGWSDSVLSWIEEFVL